MSTPDPDAWALLTARERGAAARRRLRTAEDHEQGAPPLIRALEEQAAAREAQVEARALDVMVASGRQHFALGAGFAIEVLNEPIGYRLPEPVVSRKRSRSGS